MVDPFFRVCFFIILPLPHRPSNPAYYPLKKNYNYAYQTIDICARLSYNTNR